MSDNLAASLGDDEATGSPYCFMERSAHSQCPDDVGTSSYLAKKHHASHSRVRIFSIVVMLPRSMISGSV